MPVITLRLLGPLEVRVGGDAPPPELLWRKHAALLAYLTLEAGRPRAREQLIGLLWPDKPEDAARHSLNEAVRVIRRAGGPDAIVSAVGVVRLGDRAVEADAVTFGDLAQAGDPVAAARLVAGDLLEGFALADCAEFEQWLDGERRRWRQRMLDTLVLASSAESSRGRLDTAAEFARRALKLDSAAEPAARCLMESLALGGDRAAALGVFAGLERSLAELGTTPDAETRRLEQKIRLARTGSGRPAVVPATTEHRRLPLMEREEPLARLLESWHAGIAGSCSALLVIAGADGCGRSRLAQEFADRARMTASSVAAAHAVPGDVSADWAGVLTLARGGLLEAPGIAGAPRDAISAFARALPEWQERFPGVAGGDGTMAHALTEVVRAAASDAPVVLVVDDVQWLDRMSLHALLGLLRDCARLPVTLLLTVRNGEHLPELEQARAHVGRDWLGAAVDLPPLGTAALARLAADRFPGWQAEAHERLARRLLADTGGLPAIAGELLSAIDAGLEPETGSWPAPSRTMDATLPSEPADSLAAAVRVNYSRLSATGREVLAVASVMDDRFTPEQVGAAAGLATEAVNTALDQLEAERWVESEVRGYLFTARVVREAIARDFVTPGRRRGLRAQAGLSAS